MLFHAALGDSQLNSALPQRRLRKGLCARCQERLKQQQKRLDAEKRARKKEEREERAAAKAQAKEAAKAKAKAKAPPKAQPQAKGATKQARPLSQGSAPSGSWKELPPLCVKLQNSDLR